MLRIHFGSTGFSDSLTLVLGLFRILSQSPTSSRVDFFKGFHQPVVEEGGVGILAGHYFDLALILALVSTCSPLSSQPRPWSDIFP